VRRRLGAKFQRDIPKPVKPVTRRQSKRLGLTDASGWQLGKAERTHQAILT
jgi:hypothetical protein